MNIFFEENSPSEVWILNKSENHKIIEKLTEINFIKTFGFPDY